MKSRKLELETLEVRSAPASLIGYAPPAEPMTQPGDAAPSRRPEPAPALQPPSRPSRPQANASPGQARQLYDHNETLVRDRTRARKRQ